MTRRIRAGAVISAVAATLAVPTTAGAAGLTVTGDDGTPVGLTEGAAAQLRNMSPSVTPQFSGSEGKYSLGVTSPDGSIDGNGVGCQPVTVPASSTPVEYSGNGTYTVSLTTYAAADDYSCLNPTTSQSFTFTVTGSTAIHAPAGTLVTSKPGGGTVRHHFSVDLNPGALSYDLHWAVNPVLLPDGGLDAYQSQSLDPPGGAADIEFDLPGLYTFVARATAGTSGSPWSAPVRVKVMAPFDFSSTPVFGPKQGTKYRMHGKVRARATAGGRVIIAIAKGKGRFRALGSAKLNDVSDFAFSFRRPPGSYRLRYVYKGSDLVTPGAWIQKVRLGRAPYANPRLTYRG